MVSTNIESQGKIIIFFFLILVITPFVTTVIAPDTTISENNPVIEVTKVSNTSISLSWYQTTCVVDCNTYHLTYFERYELYQKNFTDKIFSLVFTTTNIQITTITFSNLMENSTYSFFLVLIWDWSTLDPEIADSYGGNKISNVITIDLSDQTIYSNQDYLQSTNISSEIERTTKQTNFSSSIIIIISLITTVLLFQRRIRR